MNYKKLITTGILASLLTIPFSFAALSGAFKPIESVLQMVFKLGSFAWVSDKFSATKFALFIVFFALLYSVLKKIGGSDKDGKEATLSFLAKKGISETIAFSLAAIGTLYMPSQVVLGIGETYALAMGLVFAGVPAAIIIWLAIRATGKREEDGTEKVKPWVKHGIRFLAALIALSVFTGVCEQYGISFNAFLLIPIGLIQDKKIKVNKSKNKHKNKLNIN